MAHAARRRKAPTAGTPIRFSRPGRTGKPTSVKMPLRPRTGRSARRAPDLAKGYAHRRVEPEAREVTQSALSRPMPLPRSCVRPPRGPSGSGSGRSCRGLHLVTVRALVAGLGEVLLVELSLWDESAGLGDDLRVHPGLAGHSNRAVRGRRARPCLHPAGEDGFRATRHPWREVADVPALCPQACRSRRLDCGVRKPAPLRADSGLAGCSGSFET